MPADNLIYKLSYLDNNQLFREEIFEKILGLTAYGRDRHLASASSPSFSFRPATISVNTAASIHSQPSLDHQLEKLTLKELAYIVVHGTTNLDRIIGNEEPLAKVSFQLTLIYHPGT